jgi:hypothetical protein
MAQAHPITLEEQAVTSVAGAITQFLGFYGS